MLLGWLLVLLAIVKPGVFVSLLGRGVAHNDCAILGGPAHNDGLFLRLVQRVYVLLVGIGLLLAEGVCMVESALVAIDLSLGGRACIAHGYVVGAGAGISNG